jgi:hypothetical protein
MPTTRIENAAQVPIFRRADADDGVIMPAMHGAKMTLNR